MSETKTIVVKFKPISLHKLFGKEKKEFQLQLPISIHGSEAVQAFLGCDEVADVLHAFKQNGRPIHVSKFNFLTGGKKLRDVMLQDCLKEGGVNVLVTLSQNIADPDIMKIVKGTQPVPKKEEKKKQEDTPSPPKRKAPEKKEPTQKEKPTFVCQDKLERDIFEKLKNLGFNQESIEAALLRLRFQNADYRAKLKQDELLNMAIDFINTYQSPDQKGKIWSPGKQEEKKEPVLDLSGAQRSPPKPAEDQRPRLKLTKADIKVMELHQSQGTTHVYSWGNNLDGQLGINSVQTNSLFPMPVFGLADKNIREISCGGSVTLALTEDGQVYHMGKYLYPDPELPTSEVEENKAQQQPQPFRDDEDEDEMPDPLVLMQRMRGGNRMAMRQAPNRLGGNMRRIGGGIEVMGSVHGQKKVNRKEYGRHTEPTLEKGLIQHYIVRVAAGSNHCLAIDYEGAVFSWGEGLAGQLGHGFKNNELYPRQIESLKGFYVTDAAAGAEHSIAVLEDGSLFGWGSNNFDQLANKFVSESAKPILMIIAINEKPKEEKVEKENEGSSQESKEKPKDSRINYRNYVRSLRDEEQKQEVKGQNIALDSLKIKSIKCSSWSCIAIVQDQDSPHATPYRLVTWGNGTVKVKDITPIISKEQPAQVPQVYSTRGDNAVFAPSNHEIVRYNLSKAAVVERINVPDSVVGLSAGSQFFSALTGQFHLLQKGKNKSGQLGRGNLQLGKELRCYSLVLNGETIKTFDSGLGHTVVVLNTESEEIIYNVDEPIPSKFEFKIKALKSEKTMFISRLRGGFLFKRAAMEDGNSISLPLKEESLLLMLLILQNSRDSRSLVRFVTKNDQNLEAEDLEELLHFLNSFGGRNILNEEAAKMLSEVCGDLGEIIKKLKNCKAKLREMNRINMVNAKLKYIEFIHKANQQYRDMARQQRERAERNRREQEREEFDEERFIVNPNQEISDEQEDMDQDPQNLSEEGEEDEDFGVRPNRGGMHMRGRGYHPRGGPMPIRPRDQRHQAEERVRELQNRMGNMDNPYQRGLMEGMRRGMMMGMRRGRGGARANVQLMRPGRGAPPRPHLDDSDEEEEETTQFQAFQGEGQSLQGPDNESKDESAEDLRAKRLQQFRKK